MILCGAAPRGEVRVQRAILRRNFILRGNMTGAIGGVEIYAEPIFGHGEGSNSYQRGASEAQ